MFELCISLGSLPDIEKWEIQIDNNIYELYEDCISNLNIIFLTIYMIFYMNTNRHFNHFNNWH